MLPSHRLRKVFRRVSASDRGHLDEAIQDFKTAISLKRDHAERLASMRRDASRGTSPSARGEFCEHLFPGPRGCRGRGAGNHGHKTEKMTGHYSAFSLEHMQDGADAQNALVATFTETKEERLTLY